MSNLSVKNVVKIFGVKPVLSGVSLHLNPGDKVALVGENGAGKTTLLRILSGDEEPTKGSVMTNERIPRLYMAQEFPGHPEQVAGEFIGGEKAHRAALRYLDELDIDPKILEMHTGLLSGGQKKMLQLVKAFVSKSPYLLLDEPENHLDYFAREWLITTLRNYRGCVVLVSHDQYVIDQVANKIVEIEDGKLTTFQGDYQFYLEEKARQVEGRYQEWQHMEREIERHRKMVIRMRQHAKRNSDVAGVYRNKVRQLERLVETQQERPRIERKKMKVNLADVERKSSKRILLLDNFSLKRGGRSLFYNTGAQLFFGEKVALLGRNGSGKTSLFKAIQGELEANGGNVRVGVNINVGYFSQEHTEELDEDSTPIEELNKVMNGGEQKVRSFLNNFLIDSTAASRSISTLSGGQKTRLRFAKLFSRDIDFLLLDEPTNHLDTMSWQVLVEALKRFTGTVLLVSHDRAFVDETVEKLWVIDKSTIKEFFGNLSEFLGE